MKPVEILAAFDRYLATRNLRLEAVVIGGAALNLLGVVSRPTKDCDILLPPLPAAIVEASACLCCRDPPERRDAHSRRLGHGL
jgi:hypothetical protein